MTKRCSICKKWKKESQFYRQDKTKEHLRSECKKCAKEASRKYYERNKAKVLETARKRYARKRKSPR